MNIEILAPALLQNSKNSLKSSAKSFHSKVVKTYKLFMNL